MKASEVIEGGIYEGKRSDQRRAVEVQSMVVDWVAVKRCYAPSGSMRRATFARWAVKRVDGAI